MTLRTWNLNSQLVVVLFAALVTIAAPARARSQSSSLQAVVHADTFSVRGTTVYQRVGGRWVVAGEFTVPTVSMLLQYRPHVRGDFGYDESKRTFFDVVEDVSSSIDTMLIEGGRLWFGFGFYEGEGWEGYGGVGFFDPVTRKLGVLRHPAMIDYSVKALLVTDSVLYVQTEGAYEGSSTVGNGLLLVDRRTLGVRAFVPPGTSTLWDKDDPANVGPMYNQTIPEILKDGRFIEKIVPQFIPTLVECIQAVGLDSFMVRTAAEERSTREHAAANASVSRDVLRLPRGDGDWAVRGAETNVELQAGTFARLSPVCAISGVAYFRIRVPESLSFSENFAFRPAILYPGLQGQDDRAELGQEGDIWMRETSKMRVTFIIDTLRTREQSCVVDGRPVSFEYFDPVTLRVEVRRFKE